MGCLLFEIDYASIPIAFAPMVILSRESVSSLRYAVKFISLCVNKFIDLNVNDLFILYYEPRLLP